MTLEEIEVLKQRIDKNYDSLVQQDVEVKVIYDALEILLDRDAHKALISLWLKCVDEEMGSILKALEEVERKVL